MLQAGVSSEGAREKYVELCENQRLVLWGQQSFGLQPLSLVLQG
jgi:hypothetical protein